MRYGLVHTMKVGAEASKTFYKKLSSGFFTKYMSGQGLDVGYKGYQENVEPILEGALGIEIGYPGYDGKTLPFEDGRFDYVYSSHCLEHIENPYNALRDWMRVIKVGGHVITVVPHQFLYEKKASLPSRWNGDHKRFYTPATLMMEVEVALEPNSYRVRLLEDGDDGYDYLIPPEKHAGGQYEITLVLQKIKKPTWDLT
jgi:SAM-dependent methyltransferase